MRYPGTGDVGCFLRHAHFAGIEKMVHVATSADLPYIVSLSKRHAEELGFLPRAAMAAYVTRNRVTIARENGDHVGYFLTGGYAEQIRIFQACVQLDARGLGHAQQLLGGLVARAACAGSSRITLHCRDGLESNGFWAACGFTIAGLKLGGGARRKIVNEWELCIADAIDNPKLPYARFFLDRLRIGALAPQCA